MIVRTVAYEPSRRDEFLDLMEEVWGRRMPPEEFEWWFERNPAGRSLIALAENEGRVVGAATMGLAEMVVAGERLVVPMPMHVATHPDFRGRGIFRTLEQENERVASSRWPLAISFPNEASSRIFLRQLAWSELPRPRFWARPLIRRPRVREGVEPLERFGPEVDELWRSLESRWRNHFARDAERFQWRYLESPRPYRAWAARVGGKLAAVAVTGEATVRGRRVGVLAELLGKPGAAMRAVVRRALAEAPDDAVAMLTLPPPGLRGTLLRLGFVPTPRTQRLIGKALRPGKTVPRDWRFSLGDLDFF